MLADVRSQEMFHERLRITVKVLHEINFVRHNLPVDTHWILVGERRLADDHCFAPCQLSPRGGKANKAWARNHGVQDAQGPPIDWLAVGLVKRHFRCDVLENSAQRVRARARLQDLGETELRELRIAVEHHRDILALQVPVNDILAVDLREDLPTVSFFLQR